mmetsp:Transcript_37076/g.81031  ORF Transcript_37076/g.81031 Transcript_37076/m.81031 type:complete len:221 (+) Transcript_37076:1622-2284(+)
MLLLVFAAVVVQQQRTTKQSTAVKNVSHAKAWRIGAPAAAAVPGTSGKIDPPDRALANGAAAKPAAVWVRMNKGAIDVVISPLAVTATVTAGFKCAPDTGPMAYTMLTRDAAQDSTASSNPGTATFKATVNTRKNVPINSPITCASSNPFSLLAITVLVRMGSTAPAPAPAANCAATKAGTHETLAACVPNPRTTAGLNMPPYRTAPPPAMTTKPIASAG